MYPETFANGIIHFTKFVSACVLVGFLGGHPDDERHGDGRQDSACGHRPEVEQ